MLWAPAYSWFAKSIRLLALHPTLTWGTTRDGQGCHHLPPTPSDRGEGMQTKVTSSLDTTSTLSITALAPTPSMTQAIRLEHPSQGRTMIPQANDNKSLTQIRTHQVDKDPDTYSKEAHICRGTSRGKPTTLAPLPNFPSTLPSLILQVEPLYISPLVVCGMREWVSGGMDVNE